MLRDRLGKELLFFDGGMGTLLQEKGLQPGELPEVWNLEHAEEVMEIHREYYKAGSDIVLANTFGANALKFHDDRYGLKEIITAAITNARKVADKITAEEHREVYVAMDMGPTGKLLKPMGDLSFEDAYETYAEAARYGEEAGADLIHIETMSDTYEVKAAILAARENTSLPVFVTMIFDEKGKLLTGGDVPGVVAMLEGLRVDALGMNCGLGPKQMMPILEDLMKYTSLPVVVKPNAGLPKQKDGETYYDVEPEEFAEYMRKIVDMGGCIIGGCCGTTPAHIREMVNRCRDMQIHEPVKKTDTIVSSYGGAVVIGDKPVVIGERINPTGKKKLKAALKEHDMDYILGQALEQISGGADILDVNVGLPGIDEREMMIDTIKSLQAVVDVPLQIDSTIPEVLEAALRVYNGKPLVNSVNGEEESLNNVLPLVKKYGAGVIGLALDKDGIPKKAEDRVAIAKKIMDRAAAMGIPKEDIYIDCLTLTASAEQEGVMETLNALHTVKNELGLKTVLGVSNISFGLPNRVLVNHIFLTMALTNGLDLAIINPNIPEMTGAVRAYKLLANIDKNSVDYIKNYGAMPNVSKIDPVKKEKKDGNYTGDDLFYAVEKGLKNEGAEITEALLKTMDSMEIVNQVLIPALDKIGAEFEKGTLFLPQLIMSAGVAQAAFEVIRKHMVMSDNAPVSKGKIVIATVKGDVHDIGKNIVKVLLENYGYDVIDLGKDVEYQAVVDAIRDNDVKLCGLSALMTTTLVSMKETIALIRENNLDCKVMVGGAVLTPEYAKEIDADFYAKDAKESVDIAKRVLG